MKYQKSTLKIYEYLLIHPQEHLLADLLRETHVGRSAGFEAIKELANKQIIKIEQKGRQKYLSLRANSTSLRFKLFLDELKLIALPRDVRFAVNLFVELARNLKPELILLTGSMVSGTHTASSDIDFLIKTDDRKGLEEVRSKVERVSQRVINTQFPTQISKKVLLQGVPLYGFDSYFRLASEVNGAKVDYEEALQWLLSAEQDMNKSGFRESMDNVVRKLAFCYWKLNRDEQPSKQEAQILLRKRFKVLHRAFKSELDELDAVKRIAERIGSELYV